MEQGGKKDATIISEAFKLFLGNYDKKKNRTDLVFFDVALDVQKAGQILAVYNSGITVLHSDEHVLSVLPPTLQNPQ